MADIAQMMKVEFVMKAGVVCRTADGK